MRYLSCTTLALVFFVCLSRQPIQGAATPPFSLQLKALDSTVKAGSPVRLEVKTTNASTNAISLSKSNPALEYEFSVRNPQGGRAAESESFKRMKDPNKPVMIFRLTSEVLKPGESATEVVVISEFYDLTRPGLFTIQVERRVPEQLGHGVVKSNTVSVTITP